MVSVAFLFIRRENEILPTLKNVIISGVEGNDVVTLLQEALNRRGDVKIEICAILNDTTGQFGVWGQGDQIGRFFTN